MQNVQKTKRNASKCVTTKSNYTEEVKYMRMNTFDLAATYMHAKSIDKYINKYAM